MNKSYIGSQVSSILSELLSPEVLESTSGLKDTPKRVANMLAELTSGYAASEKEIAEILTRTFEDADIELYDGMVIIKDIPIYSLCEHHMLPFFGKVHIGYIPNGRVVGLSKLARITEVYMRRLQVQERLTVQIANIIMKHLNPLGCGVIIDCVHTCMVMRGAQAHGSSTITSKMCGVFFDNYLCRNEFLRLLEQKHV